MAKSAYDLEYQRALDSFDSPARPGLKSLKKVSDSDYDPIIEEASAANGIPASLTRSVISAESGGNPRALSKAGAQGLMQLMPATASGLGVRDPYDPKENIYGGTKYLRQLTDQFHDPKLVVAAYNAGPGAVKKYGGIPPYAETQNYVRKVLGNGAETETDAPVKGYEAQYQEALNNFDNYKAPQVPIQTTTSTPEAPSFLQKADYPGLLKTIGRGAAVTAGGVAEPALELAKEYNPAALTDKVVRGLGGMSNQTKLIDEPLDYLKGLAQQAQQLPLTEYEKNKGIDVAAPLATRLPEYGRRGVEGISEALGVDKNNPITQGISGWGEELGAIGQSFTSPTNLATLAVAGLPTGLEKIASAAFIPGMLKGSQEGFNRGIEGIQESDPRKAVAGLTGGLVSGGLAGAAGIGATKPEFFREPKAALPEQPSMQEIKQAMMPPPPATLEGNNVVLANKEVPPSQGIQFVPPEAPVPEVPQGMKVHSTELGSFIYDPNQITPDQIQEKVDLGEQADLLQPSQSSQLLKKALGGERGALGDMQGDEGLRGAAEAQKQIIKNLYEKDIAPVLSGTKTGFNEAGDSLKKIFAPASRGAGAKEASGLLREGLADVAQKYDRAESTLEGASEFFQKAPQEGLKFINNIEQGKTQVSPKTQKFADSMRSMLEERKVAVQNLGTGKLQNFYENYFPHYYEDPKGAEGVIKSALGKRPLEGPKSFLKKRTFMTLDDAIKAGLKPISTNPVDYVLFKTREMDKYIMAHNLLKELKNNDLSKFVKATERPPEGYEKINDKVATIYGPNTEEGAQTIRGHYYAPDQVATIINNHLSPGLRGNAGYRAWMGISNTLNQAQLGLSAFHLGFTSFEAAISKTALALEKFSHGNLKEAIKTASQIPIAPVENILRGNKVLKEWDTPGSQGQMIAAVVDAMKKGGGRVRMDPLYKSGWYDKMVKAWREGNPLGAAVRAPFAAVDQITKPILEYLVPRQKLGIFMDMARHEMEKNPNMTPSEARETFGKVWDSVDNRMGQMVYDNLFLNKTAKDLMMASVRSVGWNIGTFREILGGAKDIGTQGKKIFKGQKPELTHRMAYMLALPLLAGTVGAITQYLMTGNGPDEMKDYFFPKTGNLDENGRDERVALPTYMKDIYAYSKHPLKTLGHKATPLISLISEMLQNKDYYGTKIWNEDDPIYQQGIDGLKHIASTATPFAVQGALKEQERGGTLAKKALPFIGITPAPSSVNNTRADDLMDELMKARIPIGARTKEEAEKSQLKSKIRRELKLKEGTPADLTEAVSSGKLSTKNYKEMIKDRDLTSLQRRFKMLTADEALKIYDTANDKEKADLKPLLFNKIRRAMKTSPEKMKQLQPIISSLSP